MRVARENNQLTFTYSLLESRLLRRVLQSIIGNYQMRPEDLDAPTAAAWYSTRGCEAARMSAEETREWLWQMHQLKSGHLRLLVDWDRQLAGGPGDLRELRIPVDEGSTLITVLNDYRLWAAARNDIGEGEMTLLSLRDLGHLKPAQQNALFEIHFLAQLIEEILRFLPGNCADWNEP